MATGTKFTARSHFGLRHSLYNDKYPLVSVPPNRSPRKQLSTVFSFALRAFLAAALLGSLVAQEPLPEPTGFINDYAGILQPQLQARLEALSQELRSKTGAEVALAVLPSLGDESLEDYTNRVAEYWGVGDQDDRGVLLLLAIEDRKLRIEVGYGLEGVIPDGRAGEIRDGMTSYLRQGAYDSAIAFGITAVADAVARDADVTLSGAVVRPTRSRRTRNSWWPWLFMLPLFLMPRRRRVGRWSGGAITTAWMLGGIPHGIGGGFSSGGHRGGGFGGFGGGGFGGGGASGGW